MILYVVAQRTVKFIIMEERDKTLGLRASNHRGLKRALGIEEVCGPQEREKKRVKERETPTHSRQTL
jgi:hypothetical protein